MTTQQHENVKQILWIVKELAHHYFIIICFPFSTGFRAGKKAGAGQHAHKWGKVDHLYYNWPSGIPHTLGQGMRESQVGKRRATATNRTGKKKAKGYFEERERESKEQKTYITRSSITHRETGTRAQVFFLKMRITSSQIWHVHSCTAGVLLCVCVAVGMPVIWVVWGPISSTRNCLAKTQRKNMNGDQARRRPHKDWLVTTPFSIPQATITFSYDHAMCSACGFQNFQRFSVKGHK